MKGLFITLLASAGLALAATDSTSVDTTDVASVSSTTLGDVAVTVTTAQADDEYYYTTITEANGGALLSASDGASQVDVSVSFVVNLTSLMTAYAKGEITTDLVLLRLDFTSTQQNSSGTTLADGDTGLWLHIDDDGSVSLYFLWNVTSDTLRTSSNDSTAVLSYTLFTKDDEGNYSIADGVSTYTSGDETYIALTYVQHSSGGASTGTRDGSTVSSTSSSIMSDTALASEHNDELTSIVLLSGYVTTATVYSSDLTDEEASSAAQTVAGIPEPTTATLSLLALAGLAARRRRK